MLRQIRETIKVTLIEMRRNEVIGRKVIHKEVRIAINVILVSTLRCPSIASALSKNGPDEITNEQLKAALSKKG